MQDVILVTLQDDACKTIFKGFK